MDKELPKEIERFNIIFRIQHIILFITFLFLAFTGWALRYPDNQNWCVLLWGVAKTAYIIHKVTGIIMLVAFGWHVAYLLYLIFRGRIRFNPVTTILPLSRDVADFIHNLRYFIGLSKTKPGFGRFSYIQKFVYLTVFLGIGIMGLSGFILTFPIFSSQFFPSFTLNWIWLLMRTLHSDKALIAMLFILLLHLYNEHLKTGKFPMSLVWLRGKVSTDLLKEEHPLEFEYLFPQTQVSKND